MLECPVCNKKTHSFEEKKQAILYHRCGHCEVIFKDPVYYQSLDEQKKRYDLHTNDPADAGYRAYFQRFLDFVLPKTEGVRSALDFGCGRSTLLADMLKEKGIETDVYDPIYHPDRSYLTRRYDLVVSTEVFEHLERPKEHFMEMLEVLDPNGYIAIQTQFLPKNPDDFSAWYYHKDPTHIIFFSPKTFRVLAEICGCEYLGDNGKHMVIFRK